MGKKQKCQACTTGWCKNHVFQLIPLDGQAYYRKKLKFRLCPKLSKAKAQFEAIVPYVNRDLKFYTPCFILEEEKVYFEQLQKYYCDNDEKMLTTHNLKFEKEPNDDETIFVAKHGRNKNYCSVCKADYEDYMNHMADPIHKKYLRANKFTGYITQMQNQLQQIPKIEEEKKIDLTINKTAEETADVDHNSKLMIDLEMEIEPIIDGDIIPS